MCAEYFFMVKSLSIIYVFQAGRHLGKEFLGIFRILKREMKREREEREGVREHAHV